MSSDTSAAVSDLLNAPEPAAEPTAPAAVEASQPPAPPASTDTPFLSVNERTVYKSKDDAIKGWNDAQNRITSLSKWEDVIGKQFDNASPETVAAALNEFFKLREQATQTPQQPSAATVAAATQGDRKAYDSLSPEWKAHIDYLAANKDVILDKLGLSGVQETVASLRNQNAAAQEAAVQSARDDGGRILSSIFEKEKIAVSEEELTSIADAIEARIVRESTDKNGKLIPGSYEDRFIKGDSTARSQILGELVKPFLGYGDKYAAAKNASYVAAKTTAQASQPRTMPPGTGPSSTPRTGPRTEEQRTDALKEMFTQAGWTK